MKLADQRIQYVNEVITHIKLIKLYSWEKHFAKRIVKVRGDQESLLHYSNVLGSITRFIGMCGPMIVSLATFGFYVGVEGHTLDTATVFTSLLLFNTLKEPLSKLPEATNNLARSWISAQRIQTFLKAKEHDFSKKGFKDVLQMVHPRDDQTGPPAIVMESASFGWAVDGQSPIIRNLSVTCPQGKLIFIVGSVGSGNVSFLVLSLLWNHPIIQFRCTLCSSIGKSTFLQSILNETIQSGGDVYLNSDLFSHGVSYASQEPWLIADTLRNNVLFGEQFDLDWYLQTIRACALIRDLELLKDGDASMLGEKGVQLSGGQK
jgi:ABC-type multidrug transport system fused ATPase/permease subunit